MTRQAIDPNLEEKNKLILPIEAQKLITLLIVLCFKFNQAKDLF